MVFWLLLVALVELGVITIAALVVLARSSKQQSSPGGEIPLMLPLEEIMGMRKDPRLNKPPAANGNGEENGSGQYL